MINNSIIWIIPQTIMISGILAQIGQEPFDDEKSDKVYYIQAISEAPVIDGILDESLWSLIPSITAFVQEDPDNMEEPTEKTEVYLTYDKQSLYVAARLYDSDPSGISRQLAPKDDWYGAFDVLDVIVSSDQAISQQLVLGCQLLNPL